MEIGIKTETSQPVHMLKKRILVPPHLKNTPTPPALIFYVGTSRLRCNAQRKTSHLYISTYYRETVTDTCDTSVTRSSLPLGWGFYIDLVFSSVKTQQRESHG